MTARNVHDTGICAVLFNSIANTTALVKNASNVAHAQPAIPYLGIRKIFPKILTVAEIIVAIIGIHVVDAAFDRAE
jgi:hypothetical protein